MCHNAFMQVIHITTENILSLPLSSPFVDSLLMTMTHEITQITLSHVKKIGVVSASYMIHNDLFQEVQWKNIQGHKHTKSLHFSIKTYKSHIQSF